VPPFVSEIILPRHLLRFELAANHDATEHAFDRVLDRLDLSSFPARHTQAADAHQAG
jgi:hypothetical protein